MSIHGKHPLLRLAASGLRNTVLSVARPRNVVSFARGFARYPLEYEATLAHRRVPEATFGELFPEFQSADVSLRRADVTRHGWNVKLHEEIYLGQIVAAVEAKTIFEIGTFDGGTTRRLAEQSAADAIVFTIDLPEETFNATQSPDAFSGARVGEKYRDSAAAHKIQQIRADASVFDFSPYDGAMDVVFVDAAHDYVHGLSDSRNALRIARRGGVIVWHDFEPYWSGLVHAICEANDGLPLRRLAGTSMGILRKP